MTIKTPMHPMGGGNDVFYTFTINTSPSSATVKFTVNGTTYTQKSIKVKKGTVVSYSVTATNCTSQSGSRTITADLTLSITLEAYTPSGTIILEQSTAGTYTATIATTQNYEVIVVAGGGSGQGAGMNQSGTYGCGCGAGGSGSAFQGVVKLTKGTYSVTVGDKKGDSSFSGGSTTITAYKGGNGGSSYISGTAGAAGKAPSVTATTISTTINKAGNKGGSAGGQLKASCSANGGASLYGGYGKGSNASAQAWVPNKIQTYNNGTGGYVKITAK